MSRYNELMDVFTKELRLRKYADSTIDTYCSCLAVFLRAMAGKPKPLPIDELKNFLVTIKNQNYQKQFTATIHHFYKLVLKQPLSLQDVPYPRPTDYLPEILSVQEVDRIINSYENIKHRSIISLFYGCGLRTGELNKIQVTHLNKDRLTIRVAGAKGFKDREVPVPAATMQLLISYYRIYKPVKWLFEGWGKQQYSIRSIQQLFYQGCQRAGIKRNVKPYCLRHSRATHLHDAGIDVKDIADFLGHSHIKTTADYYLRLSKLTLCNRIAKADTMLVQLLQSDIKMIA